MVVETVSCCHEREIMDDRTDERRGRRRGFVRFGVQVRIDFFAQMV